MLVHPTEGVAAILVASGFGPRLVRAFPTLSRSARAWFRTRRPWLLRLLGPSIYQTYFLSETSDDRRYAFLCWCLEGSGVAWARHYDATSVEDRLQRTLADKWCPVYEFLRSLHTSGRAFFVQVGCSSGQESFWLARERPDCTVIGTDITNGIIRRAGQRYSLPNLRYLVAGALELADTIRLLLDRESYETGVVFSSGSCQYVLPTHLQKLFSGIAAIPLRWVVALFEPGSVAAGDPFTLTVSKHRGEFSWTHNYVAMLKTAGFEIDVAEVIRPILMHRNTVHIFVVGKREDMLPLPEGGSDAVFPRR